MHVAAAVCRRACVQGVAIEGGAGRHAERLIAPVGLEVDLPLRHAPLEADALAAVEQIDFLRQHRGRGEGARRRIAGDLEVVDIARDREVEPAHIGAVPAIAADDVDALGLAVDAVDEEARRGRAARHRIQQIGDDLRIGSCRRRTVAAEQARQDDAVFDIDLIGVDGQLKPAVAPHGPQRIVDRGFRLQVRSAQRAPDDAVGGEGAGFGEGGRTARRRRRHQGDRGLGEILLLQAGRTEARGHRAAQRQMAVEIITTRHLARQGVAEVGIVFVPQGRRGGEVLNQLAFDIDIDADVAAVLGQDVGGGETAVSLRRRTLARDRTTIIRLGLARADLIGLAARFQTKGHVQRTGQTDVISAVGVDAEYQLIIGDRTGVEVGLGLGTVRGVDGVVDAVVQRITAIAQADVDIEAARLSAHAAVGRQVLGVHPDQRQVTVREDFRQRVAITGRRKGRTLLITRPAIGRPGGVQRLARIGVDRPVGAFRIAEPAGDALRHGGRVQVGAVAVVTVAVLCRHGQEAVRPQGKALPCRDRQLLAVGEVLLAGVRQGHAGQIRTIGRRSAAAAGGFAQTQVDHARNGVRAILGRCAVTQHFDAIQSRAGNGVQVDRRRTAPDRAVGVHLGRDVATDAVDQHQRLIRSLTTQGRRANRVRAVGQRRAREGDGRHGDRQLRRQFRRTALLQRLTGDDVDGHQGVQTGAARNARPGDDDFVNVCSAGRTCALGGGARRNRQNRCRCRGEQKGAMAGELSHDRSP